MLFVLMIANRSEYSAVYLLMAYDVILDITSCDITTAADRFLECIQQKQLFTVFTESAPVFVFFCFYCKIFISI